jgi:hypothetical protein
MRSRRRTLSRRFLVISLTVGIVFFGGLHLLHGRQLSRQSGALLRQADAAEQAGDQVRAADYLGRYLLLHPDDADALQRYASALDGSAKTNTDKLRALQAMERVLFFSPDRADTRRRLVALAMTPGFDRFCDPMPHLRYLLAAAPDDAYHEDLHLQRE